MKTMMSICRKLSLLLIASVYVPLAFAQRPINLQEAVLLAQRQSLSYKIALNSHQSSQWNYRSYQISRKPALYLEGTVPNYSRSINKITLSNGEDSFVSQNQAYSSVYLSLQQNITATGGILSLGYRLNRIDVFGVNSSVSYSSVPVSLAYTQSTIGYNEYRWLKKTEPLRFELADRKFVSDMEDIGLSTIDKFFTVLLAQTQKELTAKNLASSDTLLQIAKERFKLGTVGQSELLQLRLNVLEAQKALTQDSVDLFLARQELARYLNLDPEARWMITLPEEAPIFVVAYPEALERAKTNSQEVLKFRLNRLEAEQHVAEVTAANKIQFRVSANFGLSNTAPNLPKLFDKMENQQNLSIGFSMPILDWGNASTKRRRAEADLSMVEHQIEQEQVALEQEIALQVSRWSLLPQQMSVARESREISEENYALEQQRFLRGTITLNDLNIARGNRERAVTAYYELQKVYWQLYFTLRKLTLYDFEKKGELKYVIRPPLQ